MKKIVYLFIVLGLVFTGCNPLEDINADIDGQGNSVVGDASYTLTSEDYENLVDQGDEDPVDFYEMFESFMDVDDAKTMLPPFLTDKYPFWGDGSSVTVNFNLIDGNPEDVSAFTNADVYNLGADDYITELSNAFLPAEDVEGTLDNILAAQFPTPTEGQVVRLGYNEFTEEPVAGFASIFEAIFADSFQGFENIDILGAQGWTSGSTNVTGSGFSGGANANEDWLISPEIDLTDGTNLLFQITQEIDFLGDASLIDIEISTDYVSDGTQTGINAATWAAVAFDKTAFGDMTPSADFDFAAYEGETIHIALRYNSTDAESSRWRVESLTVKTPGITGNRAAKSAYYKFTEGSWDSIDGVYYLSAADYDSMGEASGQPGAFNNFSGSVLPENYLPQFLSINYPFAQEEDELFVVYRFFTGGDLGTITRGSLYRFEGGAWSTTISSLQFGLDNGIWVPDNTIRYTFTGADYSTVAAALLNEPGFEAAAGNLDNFGNFNRAGGSTNWTNDMIETALDIALNNLDPSAADGQKYVVTIATWAPGNSTEDFAMIKTGGEWVINTEG